jgi:hypothetical protein
MTSPTIPTPLNHPGRVAGAVTVAAIVTLIATACGPSGEDGEDGLTGPMVWAVDVSSFGSSSSHLTDLGDGTGQATLTPGVWVVACHHVAHEQLAHRGGGYGHELCWPDESAVDEQDLLDLTARAEVLIVAEQINRDGSVRELELLQRVEVGPLRFGEAFVFDELTYRFSLDEEIGWSRPWPYRIHVKIRECQLSNGSACGNNSRVFGHAAPSSGRALTAAATVDLPGQAGGLERQHVPGGPELEHRQDALARIGLPLRALVSDRYAAADDPSMSVTFYGGELAGPMAGPQVEQSARDLLEAAFEASFPNLTAVEPSQQYEAGPLGGQVWCRTYDIGVFEPQHVYACGWLDEWTLGFLFVGTPAALDLTEADAADLLVAMRADIETVP